MDSGEAVMLSEIIPNTPVIKTNSRRSNLHQITVKWWRLMNAIQALGREMIPRES